MRRLSTMCCLALFAACAGADKEPEAAGPTLTDFAGTWRLTTMLEGTPDPVESSISGTAMGANWTMTLQGREPIPLHVSVVGDSLIATSDPYESILRAGVTVTIRVANVLRDGALEGNIVATYQTPTGTEVVHGTDRGTRVSN